MKLKIRIRLLAGFVIILLMAHAAFASYPTSISGLDLVTGKDTQVDLASKKALVVVFVSAVCPCSNSHVGELKRIAAASPEFRFVGLHSNSDEAREDAKIYFKKAALPFPVLEDTTSKYATQFKALKTPHAFVVSPKADLVYQGGVTSSADCEAAEEESLQNYLADALQDLKTSGTVKLAKTRTLGCMISRGHKHGH